MRETGLSFYFLKNRRGMYLHELLYSPTMFHGRCTTCTAPDDILTDTRAMLDIKSGDFLENGPSQLHDGRRHYKERCDACIPAPNHIKNQYQAPTRFSEDRVNV